LYGIIFYENNRGEKPIEQYLLNLINQPSKDARIKAKKIMEYLQKLIEIGTIVGFPVVEKIEGKDGLWELRPLRDRIFFAYWKDNTFILLHHFVKKSQKTPKREIDQAMRNLKDWKERYGD
jgi:phage-related protein